MYTLAMLGLALLLVGLLLVMRRRAAGGSGGAASDAVTRALAETAATATAVPAGPMPLSPPSDADVPAGWARPMPVPEAEPAADAPFPSPFDPPAAAAWPEDEIVTAPGWPMPGELDLSWSGPATAPADGEPTPPVAPAPLGELAGTAEAAVAPGDDALMPRWLPPVGDPAGGVPEPPPAAAAEPLDPPAADAAMPSWVPPVAAGAPEDPPAFAMPTWDGAEERPAPPGDPGLDAADTAGIAWLETAAAATEPAAEESALIEWREPAGATPPAAGTSGRFAVGGTALAAGDQALGAVTFGVPLAAAPAAWCRGPVADAAPGTLVLEVEALDNCVAEDLEVADAPGFGPAADGVTLRLAAAGPGPFAAGGTYRIA